MEDTEEEDGGGCNNVILCYDIAWLLLKQGLDWDWTGDGLHGAKLELRIVSYNALRVLANLLLLEY